MYARGGLRYSQRADDSFVIWQIWVVLHTVKAETAVLGGAHHKPVQDMAALMGGYVDELSQVVIAQHRPQALTCPLEQSS